MTTIVMTPGQAYSAILSGAAPDGLTVEGWLDLRDCTGLTALPDGLTVGGSLYLSGCPSLTTLPNNLTVRRDINLSGCTGLTTLPNNLTVGADLFLFGCTGITALPAGITVGGGLYLSDCTGITNVYRAGADSRGYEFFGATLANGWRVLAGCRNFSPSEARAWWSPGGGHPSPKCLALAEKVIAAEKDYTP